MLKRCIHILISFWLINSVAYFHVSNPADLTSLGHSTSTVDASVEVNTWSDCIIQSFITDDDDASGKAHKIKYQRRYVRSRTANDNAFLSSNSLYLYYQHLKYAIVAKVNHYIIGVALLPSYYKFLFRLSPF